MNLNVAVQDLSILMKLNIICMKKLTIQKSRIHQERINRMLSKKIPLIEISYSQVNLLMPTMFLNEEFNIVDLNQEEFD